MYDPTLRHVHHNYEHFFPMSHSKFKKTTDGGGILLTSFSHQVYLRQNIGARRHLPFINWSYFDRSYFSARPTELNLRYSVSKTKNMSDTFPPFMVPFMGECFYFTLKWNKSNNENTNSDSFSINFLKWGVASSPHSLACYELSRLLFLTEI